jgi:hypothetical protein
VHTALMAATGYKQALEGMSGRTPVISTQPAVHATDKITRSARTSMSGATWCPCHPCSLHLNFAQNSALALTAFCKVSNKMQAS